MLPKALHDVCPQLTLQQVLVHSCSLQMHELALATTGDVGIRVVLSAQGLCQSVAAS